MNFSIACDIIAKKHGYQDWKDLMKNEAGLVHYYQEAADVYADYKIQKLKKQ